jgi:RecB family exonuclease
MGKNAMRSKPNFGERGSYLSVSQLETLSKCGYQWVFRYIDGIVEPGSLARAKGSGIHDAANVNFEQKIVTDTDIPVAEFTDAAVAAFEGEVRSAIAFTPDEESEGTKKATARQKDNTAALAREFHLQISPDYRPQAVEQPFTIDLPSAGTRISGVIDLIDLPGQIIDHKTGVRSKTQADADNSLQLTTYAAHRVRVGLPPTGIILESLSQTKAGNISRKRFKTSRGPIDFHALANRIVAAQKVISSGAFMPAPTGAWWCSPQWCGYWSRCPAVNRDRALPSE